MILFVVSIVIAMLAVGALALLRLLSTEHEATLLRGDEIQAGQLVDSGAELIALTLETPEIATPTTSEAISDALNFSQRNTGEAERANILYDNPTLFRGVEVVPAGFDRPRRGAGRFTVFAPRIENNRLRGVRFGLVNESARLHLGTVLQWEQESPGQGVRALIKLPGMTPAIADSILDWIDADKTPRGSGAELEYYERIGVAYRPRNAVPATLEELLLVRDMTRKLLFGSDESYSYGAKMSDLQRLRSSLDDQNDLLLQVPENTTGIVTEKALPGEERVDGEQDGVQNPVPESALPDNIFGDLVLEDGEPPVPWCFLLTVVSAEKLVDPHGTAKLYINDENLEFLEERLKLRLDEDSVAFVLLWRKVNGTLENPIDLLDATLTDPDSQEERKSPFSLEETTAEAKFLTLLDYATCRNDIVVTGRINVNEAPQAILEAVPELNEEIVTKIIARRSTPGRQGQGRFRHPEWLLAEKLVDKTTMKKLSNRLTTGGDVYRAQVVGFFDGQGTASRAEIVIDATVKPPRQIFRKDLTMFGSGFE